MAVLGRREVLGGALGLLVVTACDVDDLRPPEDEAAPTPSSGPSSASSASAGAEPDADTRLAEDAAYEIAVALALVDSVRRSFPRLRVQVQPLARMHRTHLTVLEPPAERSIPAPAAAATRAEALQRVRTAEEALQRTLTVAAVAAQSGALARLLASVSASVAQHTVAHLPSPAVDGGPR